MKKALIALVVLAVLGAVGAFLLLSNIGPLVKRVVEDVGTRATGAPVTVQTVELSLTEGTGGMQSLVIGNPEGFDTASAFEMGEVRLTLDTSSLGSNPVVIKQVLISGPQVTYEVGLGKTNIGTIQDNIERFVQGLGGGGGDGGGEGDTAADGGSETKLIIEQLHFQGGQVNVSAKGLGGKSASAKMPEIHLTDIGRDTGGATPGQIAGEVLGALARGALQAVADSGIAGLDGIKDGAKKALEDTAGEAGKTLKGLLGGDK